MDAVFAFEWCKCVYESAFGVRSLHATKAGAYRAMRAALIAEAEEGRDSVIRFGRIYGRGWKHLAHEAWRVRRIEVSP